MKYRFLLLIFLVGPAFALAQGDYKPGYVVSLNGDTIKGFISYKKKEKNFRSVYMAKTPGGQAELYPADQTAGFGIYGIATFRSFNVWISQDTPLDMNFTIGKDTTKVQAKVFLRLLIVGSNVSLFSYTDPIKQRFYIREKNGVPVELEYHEYVDAVNQLDPITETGYKIQLQKLRAIYAPGNKALINQIQEAGYDILHLAKIAARLNDKPDVN